MRMLAGTILVLALVCLFPTASRADLMPYSQDFEGLVPAPQDLPDTSLGDDGWLLWVNVWDAYGNYLYNYGTVFPAPNHGEAISAVVSDEGGPAQGDQQLSIFSDYFNGDHAACGPGPDYYDSSSETCKFIEVNVYHEQVIGAADVGTTWRLDFDAKRGNFEGATTALAFFKTLHPTQYWLSSFLSVDMTGIPDEWDHYSLSIFIDPSLEGHLLQFGFLNTATAYEGSGIFYDNVSFGLAPLSVDFDIKPGSCPNPMNAKSRGRLPVAVLGSAEFDVADIDVASLKLEGVSPVHSSYEDVAGPYDGGDCGCAESSPDGWDDLTLKFMTQDIIEAMGPASGTQTLTLTGELLDGTAIEGLDCVIMVGGGQRSRLAIHGREAGEATSIRSGRPITLGER